MLRVALPRTPTIFLNREDFKKLEKKMKAEGHKSMYAYIKDLLLKEKSARGVDVGNF